MDSIEILAIVVNIAVAGGTILLAYFTYRSVKASEKQVEMARKSIEKPRILENINDIIEKVQSDVAGDITRIQKNELFWFVLNERDLTYAGSLVFPLSKRKPFYTDFFELVSGPGWDFNQHLTNLSKSIGNHLSQRNYVYTQIDGCLIPLVNDVRNYLKKNREIFIRSMNSIKLQEDSTLQGFYIRSNTDEQIATISYVELDLILESLVISSLFKPLQEDYDYRKTCLGYTFLTNDISSKIPAILHENPISHSSEIIQSIEGKMQSLLQIDDVISTEISEIKRILRDEYILTEQELNPYRDF